MKHIFHIFAIVMLLVGLPVFAQSASVGGQVIDPFGALVRAAKVSLTNELTNVVEHSTTNDRGMYSLPYVQPGKYTLNAEAAGFKRFEEKAITVETAQNLALDVKLQIGSAQETVTVNGSAIQINTTNGSVSTVIDQQFVANTPLDGRSFQDLISLTPGVTLQTPQINGANQHGDFNVNGQRTEQNAYIVDGVSANTGAGSNGSSNASQIANGTSTPGTGGNLPASTAMGTTQSLLSVDALQEFRVLSSSYSAEYGQFAGGQFIFTTRSGTSNYHGTASEYLRNDFTDANNWFNNYNSVKQTPLRMNDFGGTFGGPVSIPKIYDGKDKTFFFVSYEGLRSMQPQPAATQYVPSLSARQNGASSIQQFLNAFPLPTGAEVTVKCVANASTTQTPCPTGDAAGTAVPSGLATYSKAFSNPSNFDSTSLKIDQNITPKMRVFFRWGYTPSQVDGRSQATVTAFHYNNVSYTAGATNQFSNSMANSFRANFSKSLGSTFEYDDNFGGAVPISNLASAMGLGTSYPNALPAFWVFVTGVGYTNVGTENVYSGIHQWNLVDTLSKSLGHHQLKFGVDYLRVESLLHPIYPQASAYYWNWSQLQTGLAQRVVMYAYNSAKPVFNEYGLFAQDEWRIASRVSLSLGLRWELDPPPTNAGGLAPFTVLGSLSDPSSLALSTRGTPLYQTTYHNFAPRVGAAWQAHASPGWETVVRAGAGVFFDRTNQSLASFFTSGPGFAGNNTYLNVPLPVTETQIAGALPTMSTPYSGVFLGQHLQLPYTLQWNLSLQQSLGNAQTFTVSYVGAAGRRLLSKQTFKPGTANTNFTSVTYMPGNVTSDYDALQLQFQRALTHGIQALASYTWSHSIDVGSQASSVPLVRGNSDFDLRQNFQMAVSWNLPGVKGNPVLREALSHWAMDGRFILRTGFPVLINGNSLTDSTGGTYYSGVNLVSGVPLYIYGAECTAYYIAHGNGNSGRACPGGRAINPAAFSLPTGTDVGNAPRNYARGFGQNQINFAVRREFPVAEWFKLQFRAEAFNLLNHPVFGTITNTLTSSTFGEAGSTMSSSAGSLSSLYQTGGPRSMQFALRLLF
jgi:hypothetical protein